MPGCADDLYDSNMANTPGAIRSYSLFGESGELPDVLHCETIAARSSLHGWELAPHRHARLHQVLLVRRGAGLARLEGGEVPLRTLSLVNVPPGDVHAFSFKPGTEGCVATLPDELIRDVLARAGDERRTLARSCVVKAGSAVVRTVAQLAAEFDARTPARALVLRGLATTLLGLVARAMSDMPVAAELTESNLVQRFEALVEAHFLERWSVARYARALSISPTHLSRVARTATGRSASRLIDERLIREARRDLAFSSLSVKTIGYALGYADPAHFSRAFARAVGRSPRAFREQLQRRGDCDSAALSR